MIRAHRDDSHAAARVIAGDRNQQPIATKRARHRECREQSNRARDRAAGSRSYRDIQAAAAEVGDQLVGGVATNRMADLIVQAYGAWCPRRN